MEKCWSVILDEEWLTMEIKRHSNKVYRIYAKEKESRQSHYIRQSRAEEEGMMGGMVNRPRPRKRVGANRRNSGADLNHSPVTNKSGSKNNSNISRCGAVAAYK